jgi:AraC-like DNA-binding protein
MHARAALNAVGDSCGVSEGLFREGLVGRGRGIRDVFSHLGRRDEAEVLAADRAHDKKVARLTVQPGDGQGHYEFYRISDDFFVVATDAIYDAPRFEVLPGEGLVEFHVKLSGRLSLSVPGEDEEVIVVGPRLLIWAQPHGVDTTERMDPGVRENSVSLYCRAEFLLSLLARDKVTDHPLLTTLEARDRQGIWHSVRPLSPTAMHLSRCLLHNPYREGLRLLYAESRALELLCETLSELGDSAACGTAGAADRDLRRLDVARRILATQFRPPPRTSDVARAVGLSESKLKRDFKQRFGVTVFDYGLECRMRHARELLLTKGVSVSEVADAVGYSHHTSFTAAFRDFFGCLPQSIRGPRASARGAKCSGARSRPQT